MEWRLIVLGGEALENGWRDLRVSIGMCIFRLCLNKNARK